jgi:ubiquitin C-terminal hydrolase
MPEFKRRLKKFEYKNDSSAKALVALFETIDESIRLGHHQILANPVDVARSLDINPNIQEDAQEFLMNLMSAIDKDVESHRINSSESSVNTKFPISSIFQGQYLQSIKCLNVSFTKTKIQNYFDISLDILNNNNFENSMEFLLKPDLLVGDNQYKAGEFGLQDAEIKLNILTIPDEVICIHLKRFNYDFYHDKMIKVKTLVASIISSLTSLFIVKVNSRFEFPMELNMTRYLLNSSSLLQLNYTHCRDERDELGLYDLRSIVVHSGYADFGHYISLIRPDPLASPEKWFKCDDRYITEISSKDVLKLSYGDSNSNGLNQNAYMLFYSKRKQ